MEFQFKASDLKQPPCTPPSHDDYYPSNSQFPDGNASNLDLRKVPIDLRVAIEKQIRDEIMVEEIARRRIIAAEVRRELMTEIDMALMRFESRLPFMIRSDNWSSVEQQQQQQDFAGLWRNPSRDLLPPRVPDPQSPIESKKDKLIMLAKHDANVAGSKRERQPESGVPAMPLASAKKPEEELGCALCQVVTTNEKVFNDHLQGKKHKAREERLRAQWRAVSSTSTKPKPKEIIEHLKGEGTTLTTGWVAEDKKEKTSAAEGMAPECNKEENCKFWSEMCSKGADNETVMDAHQNGKKRLQAQWRAVISTSTKPSPKEIVEHLKVEGTSLTTGSVAEDKEEKTSAAEAEGMAPECDKKKENYKFWCEMCSKGADNETVMDAHRNGKKHKARLKGISEKVSVAEMNAPGPPPPVAITSGRNSCATEFLLHLPAPPLRWRRVSLV